MKTGNSITNENW